MLTSKAIRQRHNLFQQAFRSGHPLLCRHYGASCHSRAGVQGIISNIFSTNGDKNYHHTTRSNCNSSFSSFATPLMHRSQFVLHRLFSTDSNEITSLTSTIPSPSTLNATPSAAKEISQTELTTKTTQSQSASLTPFGQSSTDGHVVEKSSSGEQGNIEVKLKTEIPTNKSAAGINTSSPEQNKSLQVQLQDARIHLHKITADTQRIAHTAKHALTCHDMVECADKFMALINSSALDKSLGALQKHISSKKSLQKDNHQTHNILQSQQELELEEDLSQAKKSMIGLHRMFLIMVESCLPPLLPAEMDGPSLEKYSTVTVGRSLQLSRRAEELGFPLHLPLYQRLAMGIVLTSLPSMQSSPKQKQQLPLSNQSGETDTHATHELSTITPLIPPGQFQHTEEGLYTNPLSMELLDICNRVVFDHQIPASQRQQFALDILGEPFLALLRQKQYEEALGLLRGWGAQFATEEGKGHDDMLNILGEEMTLDALEIAKSWLNLSSPSSPSFETDVQSNSHANELINILQVCLTKILHDRKERAKHLGSLLSGFISVIPLNDDDIEGNDSDFDGDDDYSCSGRDRDNIDDDSDSDDEDDDSSIFTVKWVPPPNSHFGENGSMGVAETVTNFPAMFDEDGPDALASRSSDAVRVDGDIPTSISFRERAEKDDEEDEDDDEGPIIEGLSNKIARQRIYMRNSGEWILPDIVPQLVEWNKGNALSFTLEFERFLAKQMARDEEEDEDRWD